MIRGDLETLTNIASVRRDRSRVVVVIGRVHKRDSDLCGRKLSVAVNLKCLCMAYEYSKMKCQNIYGIVKKP